MQEAGPLTFRFSAVEQMQSTVTWITVIAQNKFETGDVNGFSKLCFKSAELRAQVKVCLVLDCLTVALINLSYWKILSWFNSISFLHKELQAFFTQRTIQHKSFVTVWSNKLTINAKCIEIGK